MAPRALGTHALSQAARTAKKDFKKKCGARNFVAVGGMDKRSYLRASTGLVSVLTSNCFECKYCTS